MAKRNGPTERPIRQVPGPEIARAGATWAGGPMSVRNSDRGGGARRPGARILARHFEIRPRLAARGERSGKLYLGFGDDLAPVLRAGAVENVQAPAGQRSPVGKV